MTAPALTITGTSPFKEASRPHVCASPWPCDDIATGQRGGYVGVAEGAGPLTVCGPCLDRIVARGELSAPEPGAQVEQTEAPEQPAAPESLVIPPVDQLYPADLDPWPGELCECATRTSGFSRDQGTGRWVHNDCGRPALRYEDGRPDEQPVDAAGDPVTPELEAAGEHDIEHPAVADVEGDDPADAAAEADVPECACAKVTKRAKFGRTPDGRPTHKSCGGVLREKHRHLLPEDDQPACTSGCDDQAADANCPKHGIPKSTPDQTEARPDDQPAADAGDDGAAGGADPDRGSGTGVEARPDDGAARAGEGGGEGGEGEGRRADGGDPRGGLPAGPGGSGLGDPAQPTHHEPVEGEPARGVASGLEGAQGLRPGDVGPVGEEVHRVPPRGDEVGLAAFYGQPVEDDETPQTSPSLPPASTASAGRPEGEEALRAVGSLIAFYRQPTEDEAGEVVWQAAAEPVNDREYLGGFSTVELIAEAARRLNYVGTVTAFVLDTGGQYPDVVRVPR